MADIVSIIPPKIDLADKNLGKVRLMPMYKVILHNDDVNSMHHVVRALQDVFKFEAQSAFH